MDRLFTERERAAETAFVHEEELRFLAHRRAIQALATWASDAMGFEAEAAQAYQDRLLDDFIASLPQDELVQRVQTDLERAGKPAMTTQVTMVLARAEGEAIEALRGHAGSRATRETDPFDAFETKRKTAPAWGSLRF